MSNGEYEKLSDSYLRIRAMLNAYDTNYGGENRFEVTENKLKELINRLKSLSDLEAEMWRFAEEQQQYLQHKDECGAMGWNHVESAGIKDEYCDCGLTAFSRQVLAWAERLKVLQGESK